MGRKLDSREKGVNVVEHPRRQGRERSGILIRLGKQNHPWECCLVCSQERRLETATGYTVGVPWKEDPGISSRAEGNGTRPQQFWNLPFQACSEDTGVDRESILFPYPEEEDVRLAYPHAPAFPKAIQDTPSCIVYTCISCHSSQNFHCSVTRLCYLLWIFFLRQWLIQECVCSVSKPLLLQCGGQFSTCRHEGTVPEFQCNGSILPCGRDCLHCCTSTSMLTALFL